MREVRLEPHVSLARVRARSFDPVVQAACARFARAPHRRARPRPRAPHPSSCPRSTRTRDGSCRAHRRAGPASVEASAEQVSGRRRQQRHDAGPFDRLVGRPARRSRRVLRRHVRPDVSLRPRARRQPRSRIRESRLQSGEIARMVDVNERAEARHAIGVKNGTVIGASGAGSGVGGWQSPLAIAFAVAYALAQGQGGLPGGANSSGLPKSPAAAISERRRSTPSGVSRCSRKPVERGFALSGRSGPPAARSAARRRTPTRGFYRSSSSRWQTKGPSRRSRALRSPGCSASLLSEAGR